MFYTRIVVVRYTVSGISIRPLNGTEKVWQNCLGELIKSIKYNYTTYLFYIKYVNP